MSDFRILTEIEQAVLGALIKLSVFIECVKERGGVRLFNEKEGKALCNLLLDMKKNSLTIDRETVLGRVRVQGKLESIPVEYISSITEAAVQGIILA